MLELPEESTSAAVGIQDSGHDAAGPAEEVAQAGVIRQLGIMLRTLMHSPVRYTLILLALAILLVILATTYGQVRLNAWYRPFYNALKDRDFGAFFVQLGVFGIIAGSLLVLNVAQRWLNEMLTLKLREGLVERLIDDWMQPRRAFRLASAGPLGVNPDQRMHQDATHLTQLTSNLGIGLLQASVLLISFIGVLWVLSSNFALHIGGTHIPLPGYMVWAALLYAGGGSLLSYRVGRHLIPRNAERYAREADLRFSMVRVNEHLDAITLAGGEASEARRLRLELGTVLLAMRRLVTGLTQLTWVTAGFGWTTVAVPILVAAPLYFSGSLSFGGLMMAAGAFTQAQSSLSWFVDNFSTIADWRATLLRVANFRRAVASTGRLDQESRRISVAEGLPGRLVLDHLEVHCPAGTARLEEPRVELRAGERVLIMGKPRSGKTLLFRAIAGLWPWGSGRIERPRGERILYMSPAPYLPPGTLREVLAYPLDPDQFETAAYIHALVRLGLERLTTQLDLPHRWDRELNEDDRYCIAFARAVLQRPRWVLIDGVLGRLEGFTLERVVDVFATDLEHTAVVHFARTQAHDPLFWRVLRLSEPNPLPRGRLAAHG